MKHIVTTLKTEYLDNGNYAIILGAEMTPDQYQRFLDKIKNDKRQTEVELYD